MEGGQTIQREVPIDIMPIYVRAGSILPWGPAVQYSTEKKWDNLTIRIYPGADAEFTLYEDEFDNYNYEKGAYTTILMKWDDKERTLTINERKRQLQRYAEKTANSTSYLLNRGKDVEMRIAPPLTNLFPIKGNKSM